MKKFRSGDIIYNSIKTYPKVRFFANSGSITFNNDADNSGAAVLFDFLRGTPQAISEFDCIILTEASNPIITQNENYIAVENCGDFNFILAEDGQVLLEETGTGLAPE